MNSGSDKPCSFYALISSPVSHRGHLRIIAEYQMLSICYHMLSITSASPVFMRVSAKTVLFQLYGSGRFRSDIVEYPVHAFDLIDDTVHALLQDRPGDLRCLGGHEITGQHRAEDDGNLRCACWKERQSTGPGPCQRPLWPVPPGRCNPLPGQWPPWPG